MDKDSNFNNPALYQIRLQEDLGAEWNLWFGGFEIVKDAGGGCLLEGSVADQAALHGLMRKVRDLGLTLVSVQRMETQKEKGEMA